MHPTPPDSSVALREDCRFVAPKPKILPSRVSLSRHSGLFWHQPSAETRSKLDHRERNAVYEPRQITPVCRCKPGNHCEACTSSLSVGFAHLSNLCDDGGGVSSFLIGRTGVLFPHHSSAAVGRRSREPLQLIVMWIPGAHFCELLLDRRDRAPLTERA